MRTLLRWADRWELPTWTLLGVCYAAFFSLTYFWTDIPIWFAAPLGAYLICLFGHIQHEVLHGHPTRNRMINRLLVLPPLTLWIPYEIYRDSHIAHHQAERLTDPDTDPESFYIRPAVWSRLNPVTKALYQANNTFIGRMTLGPALMVFTFWKNEIRRILQGEPGHILPWVIHILLAGALVYWLFGICGIDPLTFVAFTLYPGLSLTLLRSFVEHRPGSSADSSCAIVESGRFFGLLFLNNNLHVVHHAEPGLAWYRIPARYHAARREWLSRNEGFHFSGYAEIAARFLFRQRDTAVHQG